MRGLWAWVVVTCVAGCGGRGRPTDAGVHGPEGGVLTFDAAMLVHGDDAAILPRDAGRPDAWSAGNDAGHSCIGVAEPCSLLGSSSCLLQLGCHTDGRCDGISTSCYSLFDSFSCGSQQGCFWSSSSRNCSGSAWPCDLESSSSSCIGQEGCSWQTTCTGVEYRCSQLFTQYDCDHQLGCTWD